MAQNITHFDPNWAFPDYRPVAAFKSLRFALLYWIKPQITMKGIGSDYGLLHVLYQAFSLNDAELRILIKE